MNNYKYESELLLKYIRDGLIEEEHFGNVVLVNKEKKNTRNRKRKFLPIFSEILC